MQWKLIFFLVFFFGFVSGKNNNEMMAAIEEDLKERYPYVLSGYTADGSPVWIMEIGKWNFRAAVEAGGPYLAAFNNYCNDLFHRLKESKMVGKNKLGFVLISDAEGLSYYQLGHYKTLQVIRKFQQDFIKAQGDSPFKVIVVNANAVVMGVYRLLRPLFGSRAKDVEVYGWNSKVWKSRILELVPQNQLPAHYGGASNNGVVQVFG